MSYPISIGMTGSSSWRRQDGLIGLRPELLYQLINNALWRRWRRRGPRIVLDNRPDHLIGDCRSWCRHFVRSLVIVFPQSCGPWQKLVDLAFRHGLRAAELVELQ
jgi:hypothetical protein